VTEIARARRIAATQQSVWDVLADFAAISAWADNVDHSCMLRSAADGGAVGASRRIQTGRITLVERIVEHDAPRALVYEIEGLPARLRTVRNRWSLIPDGGSATIVSLTTTVDIGPRPPQKLAERVVARVLAKQSDAMLADIAAYLEGSHDR
jgi:carbon monoxide dehydrogenase subunit G